MLQETVQRLAGLVAAAPIVVCNEAHRFLVAEQLRLLGVTPQAIILDRSAAIPPLPSPWRRSGLRPPRCCWCCRPTT
jgi:hypothetical protein